MGRDLIQTIPALIASTVLNHLIHELRLTRLRLMFCQALMTGRSVSF